MTKFEQDAAQYLKARSELQDARRKLVEVKAELEATYVANVERRTSYVAAREAFEAELAQKLEQFERAHFEQVRADEAAARMAEKLLEVAKATALLCEKRWLNAADKLPRTLHADVSGMRTTKLKLDLEGGDFKQTDEEEVTGEPALPLQLQPENAESAKEHSEVHP